MLILSAALVLSSSLLSPFKNVAHPHRPIDQRVEFTLHNESKSFENVNIDGHSYTVTANQILTIKAPIGTVIYADSRFSTFHRGDALFTVNPSLQSSRIDLR